MPRGGSEIAAPKEPTDALGTDGRGFHCRYRCRNRRRVVQTMESEVVPRAKVAVMPPRDQPALMPPRAKLRRGPFPLNWQMMNFVGAVVPRADKRNLILYVAGEGDEWLALALEVPSVPKSRDPSAILDDHAHRMIGEFANPAAAQRAAAGFARRWLKGTKIDECRCEDIGVKRRVSGSARRVPSTMRRKEHHAS